MTATRTTSTTILAALVALLAGIAAALAIASPAAGASDCGRTVLEDWYDNGRIDRIYPLHCYEDAIDLIPKDLLPYADAEEVISRALASALRGEIAKGGCDPTPDGSKDDCKGGSSGGSGGGSNGSSGGSSGGENTGSEALPDVDTSASSSMPLPLLVLGGMSVALLAAGGLGYVSRRRQTVDVADDRDDTLL